MWRCLLGLDLLRLLLGLDGVEPVGQLCQDGRHVLLERLLGHQGCLLSAMPSGVGARCCACCCHVWAVLHDCDLVVWRLRPTISVERFTSAQPRHAISVWYRVFVARMSRASSDARYDVEVKLCCVVERASFHLLLLVLLEPNTSLLVEDSSLLVNTILTSLTTSVTLADAVNLPS